MVFFNRLINTQFHFHLNKKKHEIKEKINKSKHFNLYIYFQSSQQGDNPFCTPVCARVRYLETLPVPALVLNPPFQPRRWQKEQKMRSTVHFSRKGQKNLLLWREQVLHCLMCNDKMSSMKRSNIKRHIDTRHY